jgi:uncharacterized protein YecT (DUF1311 family)
MLGLEKMMGSVLLAGALASCGTVRAMDVAPADRTPDDAACRTAGFYAEREACHSKLDARLCASSRLCSTYRAMHEAERRLAALESRLLDNASAAYASYRASDPDYLVDLERAFLQGRDAWRAYRDRHCESVPLLQGTSRAEAEGLTEACRLEVTQARVKEIEALLEAF